MNANLIKAELSDERPHFCAKCDKLIQDRYFLRALNLFWHEDCLKCGCCDCRLVDVGTSLYTRENFLLCKSDYMRLYGNTGMCSACNKLIPAFEMVMRAKQNVYHLECFACQTCNHRFCVGDRFYLCDNKILCESDYDERQMRQQAANSNKGINMNAIGSNTNNNNSASMTNNNNHNNNLNDSINKNLKSMDERNSKATTKRYGNASTNQNALTTYRNGDFISYNNDIRRPAEMPIGVR